MSSEAKSVLAMLSILLLLFCAVVSVLSNPAISLYQCKTDDDVCATKAVNLAYPLILEANEEIGAESIDPLFQPEIEGNLSILKFKLFNTTVTGFKTCSAENAKYNDEQQTLRIDIVCGAFTLSGSYDINGQLIVLPVQGNGDYVLTTKKYRLIIDLELKTITGKDGKTYRTVKNFKMEADPLEPVNYDFRNLFNGQKDLADTVLKFANENWREVAHEVQLPVFVANIKKMVKNANKYLKTIPIEEYTQQ
ncbi:circadian clock-controlled protein daywake-like [Spodoptera frugiperda]|uniref:Circadian clock-controlled protein daywake-like n=1 Tax=Spodoptera frugiperda TaxID=7108 RepID=A0A9R0DEX9_SPOFR|nr:circadian clock-controlled protein daywake-like [Spodoptera frugiperda]